MHRLLLALLSIACLPLAGCVTNNFKVVDATTNQPIAGVQVDGYRFQQNEHIDPDFIWAPMDLAPTGNDGTTETSATMSVFAAENHFRFVFSKPGYRSAEVLLSKDTALVASPADDADWHTSDGISNNPASVVPTRNFRQTSSHDTITIRLHPGEAAASPATAPAAE